MLRRVGYNGLGQDNLSSFVLVRNEREIIFLKDNEDSGNMPLVKYCCLT